MDYLRPIEWGDHWSGLNGEGVSSPAFLRLPDVLWGNVEGASINEPKTPEWYFKGILWAQEEGEGLKILEEFFKIGTDRDYLIFIGLLFKDCAVLPRFLAESQKFYKLIDASITKRETRQSVEEQVYEIARKLEGDSLRQGTAGLFIAEMVRMFCVDRNKKSAAIFILLTSYREAIDAVFGVGSSYWISPPVLSLLQEIEDLEERIDTATSLSSEDLIASIGRGYVPFEGVREFIEKEGDPKKKEEYLYAIGVGEALFQIRSGLPVKPFLSSYTPSLPSPLSDRILCRLGIVNHLLLQEGIINLGEALTLAKNLTTPSAKEHTFKAIVLYLEGMLKRGGKGVEFQGVKVGEEDRVSIEQPLCHMLQNLGMQEMERGDFWKEVSLIGELFLSPEKRRENILMLLEKVRSYTDVVERDEGSLRMSILSRSLIEGVSEGEERRELLLALHREDLVAAIQFRYVSLEEGVALLDVDKGNQEKIYAVVLGGILLHLKEGLNVKQFWDRYMPRLNADTREYILLRLGAHYKRLIEQKVLLPNEAIGLAYRSKCQEGKEVALESIVASLRWIIEEKALSLQEVSHFLSGIAEEEIKQKGLEIVADQYKGLELLEFTPLFVYIGCVRTRKELLYFVTNEALELLRKDAKNIQPLFLMCKAHGFALSPLFVEGIRAFYALYKGKARYDLLTPPQKIGYLYVLGFKNPQLALRYIGAIRDIEQKKEALLAVLHHLYYFAIRSPECLPTIFSLCDEIPQGDRTEGVFEVVDRLRIIIQAQKARPFFQTISQIANSRYRPIRREEFQTGVVILGLMIAEGGKILPQVLQETRELFCKVHSLERDKWVFFDQLCLYWFFKRGPVENKEAGEILDYAYAVIFPTQEDRKELVKMLLEKEERGKFLHSFELVEKVVGWIEEFSRGEREEMREMLENYLHS